MVAWSSSSFLAAAGEDAVVACAALDVAGATSRDAAAAATKKLEDDQATIDALRLMLGRIEAKFEASAEALAAYATHESEHLALVAPMTAAARELATSLGALVAAPGSNASPRTGRAWKKPSYPIGDSGAPRRRADETIFQVLISIWWNT